MSTSQDITPREALTRLGASTAEAVAQVLEMFVPGSVQRGEVTVLPEGQSPFANVARGSIASSVSYVDGVTGANIFVLTPAGARGLAGAMGAPRPEDDETTGGRLSELEMSAIAEAANQTMAAAAAAIGVVLGSGDRDLDTRHPRARRSRSAADIYGTAPHAISTTFLIDGEACRLIQLVPAAFVVRMARAIDELGAERDRRRASPSGASAARGRSADTVPHSLALEEALGGINLRVWAELGRSRMPLGSALGLPSARCSTSTDRPTAPVDLYVNGDALRARPGARHRGWRVGGVARRPRERGTAGTRAGTLGAVRAPGRRRGRRSTYRQQSDQPIENEVSGAEAEHPNRFG